ncbi:MAG: Na+/H+ antiporter subunit E [Actinomycetota bacterium]
MRLWARRAVRFPIFVVYFLGEVVKANLRVAWEIITPGFSMRAGIVRVPLAARTDWETMLLANAITLTPGTLSLEVSLDRKALYVHGLYVESRGAFEADIGKLERRLLWAVR